MAGECIAGEKGEGGVSGCYLVIELDFIVAIVRERGTVSASVQGCPLVERADVGSPMPTSSGRRGDPLNSRKQNGINYGALQGLAVKRKERLSLKRQVKQAR